MFWTLVFVFFFSKFTIRTPGVPKRWEEYDAELDYFWRKLQVIASKQQVEQIKKKEGSDTNENIQINESNQEELNEIVDHCLSIFFYWVNFGPLSRGSAACGYVMLSALLLSFGYEIQLPWMPSQIQMDWEAILRPSPQEFIKVVKPWMLPKLKFVLNKNSAAAAAASSTSFASSSPQFKDVIVTLRDAYTALNLNRDAWGSMPLEREREILW